MIKMIEIYNVTILYNKKKVHDMKYIGVEDGQSYNNK
jgi:hypothetical protein